MMQTTVIQRAEKSFLRHKEKSITDSFTLSGKKHLAEFLCSNAKLVDIDIENSFPKQLSDEWLNFAVGETTYKFDTKALNETISKPFWDIIDRGGKRWRPALMLLACSAVGGNPEKIRAFTALPEIIHNGTL